MHGVIAGTSTFEPTKLGVALRCRHPELFKNHPLDPSEVGRAISTQGRIQAQVSRNLTYVHTGLNGSLGWTRSSRPCLCGVGSANPVDDDLALLIQCPANDVGRIDSLSVSTNGNRSWDVADVTMRRCLVDDITDVNRKLVSVNNRVRVNLRFLGTSLGW